MKTNKKKTTVSRRNFLVRGGSALASLFLGIGCSDKGMGPVVTDPPEPTPPTPPTPPTVDRVDVIVVGAGLSGLVAAYELVRAGHDVRVVEARDAAGGRAQTLREPFDDGLIAESGPARIPPDHDLTLGYIDHFGIETSPFYTQEGEYLIVFDQRTATGRRRACSSVGGGTRGSRFRLGPMPCRWPSPKRSETVCGPARR